jgi:hypothetical protein
MIAALDDFKAYETVETQILFMNFHFFLKIVKIALKRPSRGLKI